MIKHNILLFLRNVIKYKSSFLINITGLSMGLACVLLIYLWVNDELNVDKFHENEDRLYRVIIHVPDGETIKTWKETSGLMSELLIEELPEVEYATAVAPPSWFGKISLSAGEKNIKADGQYVEKDYFNIFSYDLVQGNEDQVLSDKNSIVISENLANKLFNTTANVIGKVIKLEQDKQFQVSGIFKNPPANSTVQFDFALSFDFLADKTPWVKSWGSTGPEVFAVLHKETDIKQVNDKLAMIIKKRFENSTIVPALVPYSEDYLYGNYENEVKSGGRIKYVRLFSIIAVIILMIACINFINLSTATASRRLKEIGIKKTVGARRNAFVFQLLNESILMSLMAMAIALLIVILFLPQFNEIVEKHLTLNFNISFILAILSIALLTGFVAGIFPALYLSGFNSVSILKGKLNGSIGELWTRKGLVVAQFTLSILLIVSVLAVFRQVEFVQKQNLGYERDNIVHFKVEGKIKDQLETFISEVKNIPGILNASATTHDMVGHNWSVGLNWEGKDPNNQTRFQVIGANYGLIETLGMEMITGRSFSRDYGTDDIGIIFNETAIKSMRLNDPIGKAIDFYGERRIIGIIKDFHFKSLHEPIEPLFLYMDPGSAKKIMLRIQAGKERKVIESLQKFYQTFNPGFPFEYQFLDENYQALYNSEQRVATLSRYFAGMAILISCLGLLGLTAFTMDRRRKEIGIRKVNGAKISEILTILNKDFVKWVAIAFIIACPIAYYAMNKWLENFAYKTMLSWWIFALAGVLALGIALLTVSWQSWRAATRNPVEALRYE